MLYFVISQMIQRVETKCNLTILGVYIFLLEIDNSISKMFQK
jgi:hypothetical protein